MSIPANLAALVGEWIGTSSLWLMPGTPAAESETTMSVRLAARGQALVLEYTWAADGSPEEGILILSVAQDQSAASATWTDSWHLADTLMNLRGGMLSNGGVSITGSYPAPTGPDWGWSIGIEPESADSFRLVMHNIMPEGEPMLAVRATYRRPRQT